MCHLFPITVAKPKYFFVFALRSIFKTRILSIRQKFHFVKKIFFIHAEEVTFDQTHSFLYTNNRAKNGQNLEQIEDK